MFVHFVVKHKSLESWGVHLPMTSEGGGNGVMSPRNLLLGENNFFVKAAVPDCVYVLSFAQELFYVVRS